jgi:hypothetical protein
MDTGKKEEAPKSNVIDILGGLADPKVLGEVVALEKKKTEEGTGNKNEAPNLENGNGESQEEGEQEGEKTVKKNNATDKNETSTVNETEEEEGGANEEEQEEEEGQEEEIEIPDNKFGFKKKKKEVKKEIKIEKFDDIPSVIKSKYGQDIKDPKVLAKFFEKSVDKWRADSQNLEKVSKELNEVKAQKDNAISLFENMPSDLLEATKAHYRGEDYKKYLNQGSLDFTKEKHSTKALVNHYFKGEFTDDDFEAEEKSKALIIAEKESIAKYEAEKKDREQRAKLHVEQAEKKTKAYAASVKSSVEALKKDFPDMAADVIEDINSTLSSGQLLSKFFNSDGTLKPTAAKMLALAEHGESFIAQLMEVAERQGESQANERFVDRARKKPVASKKHGATEKVRKEVAEKIEELIPSQIVGKRTF